MIAPAGAADTAGRRDATQRFVWLASVALIATTYPVFQLSDATFGEAVRLVLDGAEPSPNGGHNLPRFQFQPPG